MSSVHSHSQFPGHRTAWDTKNLGVPKTRSKNVKSVAVTVSNKERNVCRADDDPRYYLAEEKSLEINTGVCC